MTCMLSGTPSKHCKDNNHERLNGSQTITVKPD